VITVCDQANEACPVFFGARTRLHWSFPDPSTATGSDEEQLAVYRQVRDAIRRRIEQEVVVAAAGRPSVERSSAAFRWDMWAFRPNS
jgi:arsenate reductase